MRTQTWGDRGRRRARRALRKYLVRSAVVGLATAVRFNPLARPARHGIRIERDVAYGRRAELCHTLDVFVPERATHPMPVVFYVHGGGFSMLSKDTHWGMAMAFARRGYLVFNVNYRLAPKNPFPAPLEDVCVAFVWMAEHAQGYGGDLRRLVLAGESAGANLITALTIAATFERPESSARDVFATGVVPTAVVPACGILQVTDVERFWRTRTLPVWLKSMLLDVSSGYLGDVGVQPSAELELADPVRVFESDAPAVRKLPTFFVPVGTRDPLLDDTRRLARALERRGVRCLARYYEGEVHAFHAFVWRERARECWAEKFAFLEAVLAAEGATAAGSGSMLDPAAQ